MADAPDPADNLPAGYVPPRVWEWVPGNGGQFANINRPISGATQEQELPVGKHPIQLYSLGTPNGQKVTILLEELLAAGHAGAEYDAWLINIGKGDQFGSGFVAINPNSKIPAMVDHSATPALPIFESGAMMVYLAEKFGAYRPTDPAKRAVTMSWLLWQMGSAPFLGGGFGHFFAYAPIKIQYAIDRYAMEAKRQLHVLDTHLANNAFMVGDEYTIADMAIFPWYGAVVRGETYPGADTFLSAQEYPNLLRWAAEIAAREPVQRGRLVNRGTGPEDQRVPERHDAGDIEVVLGRIRAAQLA